MHAFRLNLNTVDSSTATKFSHLALMCSDPDPLGYKQRQTSLLLSHQVRGAIPLFNGEQREKGQITALSPR